MNKKEEKTKDFTIEEIMDLRILLLNDKDKPVAKLTVEKLIEIVFTAPTPWPEMPTAEFDVEKGWEDLQKRINESPYKDHE